MPTPFDSTDPEDLKAKKELEALFDAIPLANMLREAFETLEVRSSFMHLRPPRPDLYVFQIPGQAQETHLVSTANGRGVVQFTGTEWMAATALTALTPPGDEPRPTCIPVGFFATKDEAIDILYWALEDRAKTPQPCPP